MVTNSNLHFHLISGIIEKGFAPSNEELASLLEVEQKEIEKGLYNLEEYHGVVLHPDQPKVWVIHPFSLSPTNFFIKSSKGEWWGNCAWCSLGIATLIECDTQIFTTIGAETKRIEINIINGKIQEKNYFIHFPTPMKNAWDNVIYTCSNMLIFENEDQVNEWTHKHNIPKGDIQPIQKIWDFSKKWYGNHLNPNWKKWTIAEAQQIFKEFKLEHPIWNLEYSKERF